MADTNEPGFWARRELKADAVIVCAGGDLDAFTVDELAEHLLAAEDMGEPPAPVVVDLTDVTYLSSAGVATLVIHTQRCADKGRRLSVVAGQPAVLRPFVLTGADKVVHVAPTLEEAMDA